MARFEERKQELQGFTDQLVRNLDTSAMALVDRFQAQMVSQRDASVAEGRSAMADRVCIGTRRLPRGARRPRQSVG